MNLNSSQSICSLIWLPVFWGILESTYLGLFINWFRLVPFALFPLFWDIDSNWVVLRSFKLSLGCNILLYWRFYSWFVTAVFHTDIVMYLETYFVLFVLCCSSTNCCCLSWLGHFWKSDFWSQQGFSWLNKGKIEQILKFDKLEPENVLHFCLINVTRVISTFILPLKRHLNKCLCDAVQQTSKQMCLHPGYS